MELKVPIVYIAVLALMNPLTLALSCKARLIIVCFGSKTIFPPVAWRKNSAQVLCFAPLITLSMAETGLIPIPTITTVVIPATVKAFSRPLSNRISASRSCSVLSKTNEQISFSIRTLLNFPVIFLFTFLIN
jgi:hypothetical protein